MSCFTETPGGPRVLHCQRTADDGENLQEGPGGHHYGNVNQVVNMVKSMRHHCDNVNEVITMVMSIRLSLW